MGLNNNLGKLAEVLTVSGSNNYVGVGLTTPGEKLDVIGNIRAKYAANSSNISFEPDFGQVYLVASSADNTFGDKKMVINSSGLSLRAMGTSTAAIEILSDGTVGIGTTSPATKLSIITAAGGNTSGLSVGSTNGLLNIWGGSTSDVVVDVTNGTLNGSTATNLIIRGGGSERMRITSGGIALIGGVSRQAGGAERLFQVEGTTNFPGASIIRNTNDNGGPNLILGKSRATVNGGVTIVQNGDANGAISFVASNGVNMNSYTGIIQSYVSGTPSSTSMPGVLAFSTTPAGSIIPSERMRISSNGNVGIGTTSPQSLTHLYSATGINQPSLGTGGGHFMIQTGGVIATVMGVNINGNFYIQPQRINDGGSNVYNTLLNPSGGNVGIGTTSPTLRTHIVGTAGLPATSGTTQLGALRLQTGTSTVSLDMGVNGGTGGWIQTTNANDLSLKYPLLLNPNGANVGIGTTSPDSKLNVVGFAKILNLTTTEARGGGDCYLSLSDPSGEKGYFGYGSSASDAFLIANNLNSDMFFRNNNAERMRITSGGNVLIGTTTDAGYRLDVNGIIRSTALGGFAIGNTGGIPRIQLNSGTTFAFLAPADGLAPLLASAFNTSSDYRLKEDLKPIKGLDLVSQIKVYDYKWKSEDSRAYGVLAHELQEVLPQAVTGKKDADEMQGVDYSKLVPVLVASIQEQQAQIQELKAEIDLLKNK